MDVALELNGMSSAIMRAFQGWAKKNQKFSKIYMTIPAPVLDIATDAFSEIKTELKPGAWEIWWAVHHNRYIRKVQQKDLNKLHEIMYHFLTAFARGELERDNEGDNRRKTKGKTTA